MSLSVGSKLAHYEILGPVGKGGMGEVFRARDTKLGREVAVKILPAAMARDAERLGRFDREARALAALNHPNIAQIYGVETADGVPAMVMELVPGDTLGALMKSGPMPVEKVLDYAAQMAAGLDAAHEKGIVHRDFKPGNVMVTPEGVIKVLDFGLVGRAANTTDAGYDPENSPTLTMAATQAGVIMGTAAYMAPEQASGKPVDKRADIWAFGVVLWEMLSGKRLFEGETVSHVMAAVLTKEPDLSAVPERMRPLVSRCLEKDPRKRLRDVGDAMGLVGDARLGNIINAAPDKRSMLVPFAVAGVLALALAGVSYTHFREAAPPAAQTLRMRYAPEGVAVGRDTFTLSPDGTKLAFFGTTAQGRKRLFVRDFAELEAQELETPAIRASGGGIGWSPDSKWIVSFAESEIFKIDKAGGAPQVLCQIQGVMVGSSWNRDGVILFGSNAGPIQRVPAGGGESTPVTALDSAMGDTIHVRPVFLPVGKRTGSRRGGKQDSRICRRPKQ